MGRFTGTKEDIERASNPNKKELVVQITDFFYSRKFASFLSGTNIREEDILKFFNN
ncbi:MAG: hypothetical protein Q8N99_04910 [Nanoarchaeota archaeon]|nr:hypothetical protein [Nanoarchaeota archaeon]